MRLILDAMHSRPFPPQWHVVPLADAEAEALRGGWRAGSRPAQAALRLLRSLGASLASKLQLNLAVNLIVGNHNSLANIQANAATRNA